MSLRFTWRLFFAAGALVIHSLVGAGPLAEAQTNGGFESGFLGFETIGNATIQGDTFAPTEGSNLALLTNEDLFGGAAAASFFDVEAFLGADFGTGFNEGSALSFEVLGSVGSSLTFDFNFFTNEGGGVNDSAFLTIDGEVSTLADISSPSAPSANTDFVTETGFSNFEFAFENDGPVNVGIAVFDSLDTIVDSGIAIDNFSIGPAIPEPKPMPMPGPAVNFSFESGDFTGFETIGTATIEDASFGVQPTDGNTQALLSTAGGEDAVEIETVLNLDPGTLSGLGGTNGSALTLEFFGIEGETISFDYSFLTSELTPDPTFNDFAVVSLSSEGSSFFEVLGDTNSDFVLSPPSFGSGTPFEQFSFTFGSTGVFTLGLAVLNEGDTVVDSGLLIDNLVITVPEPSSGLLLAGALFGLISRRRKC